MAEPVNLFTSSRELDDLMLAEYPGRILESQHHVVRHGDKKLYFVFDLHEAELLNFLESYRKPCEYEVRGGRTGRLLKDNMASKTDMPEFMLN